MPSPTEPTWTFTVDGSGYGLPRSGFRLVSCVPFGRDATPSLTFQMIGQPLPARPDPFLNKSVTLSYDIGSGDVLLFAGLCVSCAPQFTEYGWTPTWEARGLRWVGDLVPITNTNTGGDTFAFNLEPDDPNYVASRAGRTLGQIIAAVLNDETLMPALDAYGIGGYTSFGTGASATVNIVGGAVDSIDVGDAGDDYTTDPAVIVWGDGTGATAHAVRAGNTIDSVVVDTGGSGYTTAIAIILPMPEATVRDLARMLVVPPFPVYVQGEKSLSQIASAVQQGSPNFMLSVEPDGTLRFLDQRLFGDDGEGYPETIDLTLDDATDLVETQNINLSYDLADNYTRVLVRGENYAEGKMLSLMNGTMEEVFDHDGLDNEEAKDAWKLSDFTNPEQSGAQATATGVLDSGALDSVDVNFGGYGYGVAPTVIIDGDGTGAAATAHLTGDVVTSVTVDSGGSGYTSITITLTAPDGGNGDAGTCTCSDTLTVEVTSNDATKAWAANYWDQSGAGHQGVIWLNYSAGAGLTSQVVRKIVANDALTPGGSATLTLDRALPHTDFDSYVIKGLTVGGSVVWRRYRPVDEDVRARLRPMFTFPQPFTSVAGNATSMVNTGVVEILYSSNGDPPYQTALAGYTIDVDTGYVMLERPAPTWFGTTANLEAGGDSTDGIPADIRFFLPVSTDTLEAICPPDSGSPEVAQYEGRAFDVYGLERTLTITVPSWRDPSQSTRMAEYACDQLDAVKDDIIEGTVPLIRFNADFLTFGRAINIVSGSYDTGLEDVALPVSEVSLQFNSDAAPSRYTMQLRVSNRRAAFTASQYIRPGVQTGPRFGGELPGYGGIVISGMGSPWNFEPPNLPPPNMGGPPDIEPPSY